MADQEIADGERRRDEPSADGEQPDTHLSIVAARPDSLR